MADPPFPAGFEPLARVSPFAELIGPFAVRGAGAEMELALRVDEQHLNTRGTLHGGVLSTMADLALGYTTAFSADPPAALATVSLSIDFAGSATTGDLLVATVDVQHLGRRMAFANCYISRDGRRIARASAVFAHPGGADPGGADPGGADPGGADPGGAGLQ